MISTTDYYAFGSALPGRQFNSDSYDYAYQGSEKDNEITNVDGAHITTYFREYDTRLGRTWSVDPKGIYMPWQSPYVSMDNNPVLYNDVLGDSTHFFSESGDLLYTSHDNLESALTIIDKDGMKGFSFLLQRMNSGELEFNDKNTQALGDHGTSYSVVDLRSLYNNNSQDYNDMYTGGYVNEHITFLVDNNGFVKINYEDYSTGLIDDASVFSKDPNAISKAHTHPNSGKGDPDGLWGQNYRPMPSGFDWHSEYKNNSYYDVVISDQYIFFLNNKNATPVAIYFHNTFDKGKVTSWGELR